MPYKDREKQLAAQKAHYQANKGTYNECRKRLRARNSKFVRRVKKLNKCNRCPESDYRCLVFHHVEPANKHNIISEGVNQRWSLKKMKAEMRKCEILCSNCHLRLHHDEWSA